VPEPAPVPEPTPAPAPEPAPAPAEISFDEPVAAEAEEEFEIPAGLAQPDDDDDDDFEVPDLDDLVMPEKKSRGGKSKRAKKPRGGKRGGGGGGRRIGLMIGWVVLMVVFVGLLAGGLFGRDMIIAAWPPAEKLYQTIGLAEPPPGYGLDLGNIKSSTKKEGDKLILTITGTITNISEDPQPVPKLRGALLDAKRKPIHDWIFEPPRSAIGSGGKLNFSTRVPNPPATARGLAVTFMEATPPKDDHKAAGDEKAKDDPKPAKKTQ